MAPFDPTTTKNLEAWRHGQYDAQTKAEIELLLKNDPEKLKNSFFKKLSFGTGGARELMGVGTNRLNKYTIRAITQALASYLKEAFPKQKIRVLVGFDGRHHSKEFGRETARTLAYNGIEVFLFQELRPTPLISFGCRHKKCHAAVMITASHNPPEYNGYKVYWQDGAQVLPPHDQKIIEKLNQIEDLAAIPVAEETSPLIHPILEEIDEAYLKELKRIPLFPEKIKKEGDKLKILYTSLHGTGITILPRALKHLDFKNLHFVEKQCVIDSNFPLAPNPNPEEKKTLGLGIEELKRTQADLLLATDPDADRVAAVILHEKEPVIFSGNQMAALLVHHILKNLQAQGRLKAKSFCVKTIVTTELFAKIVQAFQVELFDVLTGFKYIAEKIAQETKKTFLFGAEESLGYLYLDFARDKDAISISGLIAEMALLAKLNGQDLYQLLLEIYSEYGLFQEKLFSFSFPEGQVGLKAMQNLMLKLRENPPSSISGIPVVKIADYLILQSRNLQTKTSEKLFLPKSDVLAFFLEDESKIIIRPSGTEPKVKIYLGVKDKDLIQADQKLLKLEENLKAELSH